MHGMLYMPLRDLNDWPWQLAQLPPPPGVASDSLWVLGTAEKCSALLRASLSTFACPKNQRLLR